MLEVEQPIIGAINGDAVGAGATLARFCDIIVMAQTARIGDPQVRVGLSAGGGAVIWPLLIGPATDAHRHSYGPEVFLPFEGRQN